MQYILEMSRSLSYIWDFVGLAFNPVQDGEKAPATSFSPVTSTNVGIWPQNFLTFSFNPFDRLVWNFKFVPSASPKLLNLKQDHPSKKRFIWSTP